MSATYDAGMARLQEVLDAPPGGASRHAQVAEVAQQHATEEPRTGILTKQVAVAEPATPDAELTGEFEALVSDFLPDRQMETFVPGAFDKAVAKIRKSGKATPVVFGHDTQSISAVLGMVPATGWRIDHEGLHASGWLDVSEPLGRKMYGMLKNGALQWSIGFTITKTRPGRAGVRELVEVNELLELSVVPVPANERTRTTAAKSIDDDRDVPSLEELRARERELGLDEDEQRRQAIADEWANLMRAALGAEHSNGNGGNGEKTRTASELKAKCDALAREHAPLTVASFDC